MYQVYLVYFVVFIYVNTMYTWNYSIYTRSQFILYIFKYYIYTYTINILYT